MAVEKVVRSVAESEVQEPEVYVEPPLDRGITRRSFLTLAGVGVALLALGGYKLSDIIAKRNKYIQMRQAGLYKDDKRVREKLGLAASHQTPMIKTFYEEFGEHPVSHVTHHLLHTSYAPRSKFRLDL